MTRWRDERGHSAPDRLDRLDRLAELVAGLTGEDDRDSAEATLGLVARTGGDPEPLALVARAILELGQSGRSLRVTRYLDHDFEPVIDLRDPERAELVAGDRFERRGRAAAHAAPRHGDRPAGTTRSGFVPA